MSSHRLPSFLIIGAAKSGTTSLVRFLAAQPDVFMPKYELRFFGIEEIRTNSRGPRDESLLLESVTTMEGYEEAFADARSDQILGERSNVYLYTEKAPRRIHDALSDPRLIAILRDPSERAFAQFLMNVRYGSEPESDFGRALALEDERIEKGWSFLFHYRARGLYGDQLERYRTYFPLERIKVLLFDDLMRDPVATLRECAEFVGSAGTVVPAILRHNPTIVQRSPRLKKFLDEPHFAKKIVRMAVPARARERVVARLRESNQHRPTLPKKLRRQLIRHFEADVLKLQDLIGRDLSAWLR